MENAVDFARAPGAGFAESGAAFFHDAAPAGPLALTVQAAFDAAIAGEPAGIEPAAFVSAWSARFSADEIGEFIVPKRTLARRLAQREPLSDDEADRAIRAGRVSLEADRVFGNPGKAHRWLRSANRTLNGQRPIDLLRSEAGTQIIFERLGQIEHGMFV